MRKILNEIISTDERITLRALPTDDPAALNGAIREFFSNRFGAELIAPVVNRLGYALRSAAAAV